MHELHMLQNKSLPDAQVKQERLKAQRQEERKAEMDKMRQEVRVAEEALKRAREEKELAERKRREEEKKLEGQRKEQADTLQKIEKFRQQIALIKQQNAAQQSQA